MWYIYGPFGISHRICECIALVSPKSALHRDDDRICSLEYERAEFLGIKTSMTTWKTAAHDIQEAHRCWISRAESSNRMLRASSIRTTACLYRSKIKDGQGTIQGIQAPHACAETELERTRDLAPNSSGALSSGSTFFSDAIDREPLVLCPSKLPYSVLCYVDG